MIYFPIRSTIVNMYNVHGVNVLLSVLTPFYPIWWAEASLVMIYSMNGQTRSHLLKSTSPQADAVAAAINLVVAPLPPWL